MSNVLLDLNNPSFQKSWLDLPAQDAERVRSTLKKIIKMTWTEIYKDPGLKWEKIKSIQPVHPVDNLYSFRLSKSSRAVGYRDGEYLRVLLVSADHDKTYGKK